MIGPSTFGSQSNEMLIEHAQHDHEDREGLRIRKVFASNVGRTKTLKTVALQAVSVLPYYLGFVWFCLLFMIGPFFKLWEVNLKEC